MKLTLDFKGKEKVLYWWKKLPWFWTILILTLSAVFSTVMMQYLLLDAELFQKLSDKKWLINFLKYLIKSI